MVKNIILVIVLLLSVLALPVIATEQNESDEADNAQVHDIGEQVQCNPNEDTLSCTYRAMLEKGILEHPRPLSEIRRGFRMPTILYFN